MPLNLKRSFLGFGKLPFLVCIVSNHRIRYGCDALPGVPCQHNQRLQGFVAAAVVDHPGFVSGNYRVLHSHKRVQTQADAPGCSLHSRGSIRLQKMMT